MKKLNDIAELSNKLTYHSYMLSREQVETLFKDITIPEYIALEEIKSSIENGKVYLSEISENMKISISKASKLASDLKDKGLVKWSHDGDGSDGTYIYFTDSGILTMETQEKILKEYYGRVAEKFGKDKLITLLSLMSELENVMSDELEDMGVEGTYERTDI